MSIASFLSNEVFNYGARVHSIKIRVMEHNLFGKT